MQLRSRTFNFAAIIKTPSSVDGQPEQALKYMSHCISPAVFTARRMSKPGDNDGEIQRSAMAYGTWDLARGGETYEGREEKEK